MAFTHLIPALLSLLLVHASPVVSQTFVQQGDLITTPAKFFGGPISFSADGKTMVVGASNAAYVYGYDGKKWTQQAKLTSRTPNADTNFGASVSISGDGKRLVVGAAYELNGRGSVYNFKQTAPGRWVKWGPKVKPPADAGVKHAKLFGSSVAISANGRVLIVGSPAEGRDGATWAFDRRGKRWIAAGPKLIGTAEGKSSQPQQQGNGVTVSADGSTFAVRAAYVDIPNSFSSSSATWVFTRAGKGSPYKQQGPKLWNTVWPPPYSLAGPETIDMSDDGNTLVVVDNSEQLTGGGAVFVRSGGKWTKQALLLGTGAVNKPFRRAVAISGDGNYVAVGAPDDGSDKATGATWVFKRSNGKWTQLGSKLVGTPVAKGAGQGAAVALSGDGRVLAAGAPFYEKNYNGAVWLFERAAN